MIQATLTIRTSSTKMAKSIVDSVTPDNKNMKGLSITNRANPSYARFVIRYDGRIETFISTMEDLLRCVQASTVMLNKMPRERRS